MVCSELELGISNEHEGILILPEHTPIGAPLQEVLGDVVLEIDVTPNQGRIMSMVGLAREVAALYGTSVRLPDTRWEADGPPVEGLIRVEIADPALCARYSAAVIQNLQIGPAPDWMQRRLTLAGMRPVSNVVDITNYVMLELGQPLHAFDYDQVRDHAIIVRRARAGEQITTIDHEQRTLDPQTLVIADPAGAVGLAGVMGGEASEVTDATRAILLESASFDPITVARTARRLHLPSEAASRFERTVDQQLTVPALMRAGELMRRYAGATIAQGVVDVFPAPKQPLTLQLTPHEVARLLGVAVPASEIAEMLRRLQFGVEVPPTAETDPSAPLQVQVPSYRNDVTIPADLVEEVARMIGYDRIPETLIEGGLPPQHVNYDFRNREHVRDLLAALGLDEVITYSPVNDAALARLGPAAVAAGEAGETAVYVAYDEARPLIRIANPLSSEQDVMRPVLLPSLLQALRTNLRHSDRVYLFEIGSVYWSPTTDEITSRRVAAEGATPPLAAGEAEMPVEPRRIGAVLTGPREPRSHLAAADAPDQQTDFFDAKGVVETLLDRLQIPGVRFAPVAAPWYHPGRSAAVLQGDALWGIVGELHPTVAAAWDLDGRRVYAFDLDLDAILAAIPERAGFQAISRFPAVTQDLAVIVPNQVPAARVEGLIRETGGKLLIDLTLFDVYTGPPVPAGHRSLAYSLAVQAPDRTLSEDEVSKLRVKIANRLKREVGAQLRE